MSVNFVDFIKSADSLVLQEPASEINFRNAVSRAYYGVFHAARIFADDKGWLDYQGHTHEVLAARFSSNNERAKAYRLQDLHKARVLADYRIHEEEINKSSLVMDVKKCRDFLLKLYPTALQDSVADVDVCTAES